MRGTLHCHSTWCDGRDTIETMAEAAIAKGFGFIGFSSHSMLPSSEEGWMLTAEKAPKYARAVRALGRRLKGRIKVLCGVEADFIPGVARPDREVYSCMKPDYIIGSVHSVVAQDGECVSVDNTQHELFTGIAMHFDGSPRKLVEAYLAQLRRMAEECDFDIVGHPDVFRKFNVRHPFFDESAAWYVRAMEKTADVLARTGRPVEVNTGGISRGWIDDAYPSERFRAILKKRGVRFVLTSDAHSAEALDCAFDRFAALDLDCEL